MSKAKLCECFSHNLAKKAGSYAGRWYFRGEGKWGENMTEQKNTARPRGTDSAKVIRVIETRGLCGRGTEDDPCRTLIQYWGFDGELLAVRD